MKSNNVIKYFNENIKSRIIPVRIAYHSFSALNPSPITFFRNMCVRVRGMRISSELFKKFNRPRIYTDLCFLNIIVIREYPPHPRISAFYFQFLYDYE
jgi:hypothetical protein